MLKYIERVGTALSVLINVILGGALGQTFSARNWEWKRNKKPNMVMVIDMILGKNHCAECWVWWRTRKW